MCSAITKKGKECKNKNCTIHNQEMNHILLTTRELLDLQIGHSWILKKEYIDGYMQLALWLHTKYFVQ